MTVHADDLVRALDLVPHPEGGYFRETFRASLELRGLPGGAVRHASTAIYFLLPCGVFSAFHRVRGADEVWHHYTGDPVELHVIAEDGDHSVTLLGSSIERGERPQVIVPAGALQAARPVGDRFALCGCTVAPGFDFADFSMPSRAELLARFPQHGEIITRLTRAT